MIEVPVEIFKCLNVISIIFMTIFITILCIYFYKKEGAVLETLSSTVAKNKKISFIYSFTMSIFIPIYYGSLLLYLSPKYNLPIIFDITLILALAFEMAFLWLPAKGKTSIAHRICASVTCGIMLLNMLLIPIFGSNVGHMSKIIIITFIIGTLCFGIFWMYNIELRKKIF